MPNCTWIDTLRDIGRRLPFNVACLGAASKLIPNCPSIYINKVNGLDIFKIRFYKMTAKQYIREQIDRYTRAKQVLCPIIHLKKLNFLVI